MLLNFRRGDGSQIQTRFSTGNLFVRLLDQMFKSHGHELVARVVLVILFGNIALLDFVFQFARLHAATPHPLNAKIVNRLLLFRRNAKGFRFQLFPIPTVLEPPLNVRHGRIFHVLFDVRKGVLGDVGNAQIGVNVKFAHAQVAGNGFADNHLDERRFSRPVGPQHGHSRTERHLQRHIGQGVALARGIFEIHVFHFQKLLRRRLDAFQSTGIGKDVLDVIRRGQFKVVLGLGLEFDKVRHFGLVMHQAAVGSPHGALFVVNHVGANVFQKGGIVRHDQNGLVRQLLQIIRNPFDGTLGQVIGRFVHQVDIGIDQNRHDQSQFHLPTSRQGTNGAPHHFLGKFQFLQLGHAVGFALARGGH
mmetsp:Transcript_4105/g.8478  ORF Transcript_4105/g.8478 Transcript_4105/m.8478 type:complete len:361 (-) Transcript_4105:626-1708(-)